MTVQAVRLARQRDEIRIERDKALEVQGFLEQVFSGSDPGETRGETVTAREILDKGAARVIAKLEEQPETQAALALAIGKVYVSLGLNDRASRSSSARWPSACSSTARGASMWRTAFSRSPSWTRTSATSQPPRQASGRPWPSSAGCSESATSGSGTPSPI
jgi:hypothetical protein